jgi:hypothetical protein
MDMVLISFFLIIWLELSLFDLWLFRSFYLHRSSAENLVERDFLIRILFQVTARASLTVHSKNKLSGRKKL